VCLRHELGKAMGCLQLDEQLNLLESNTHVYGHSHLPADCLLPTGSRTNQQSRRWVQVDRQVKL